MASSLELDRSDPGVDEMVSGWENGGEYQVTLTVKQVSADPKSAKFEVTSVESEDMEESEDTEEEPENETMAEDSPGKEATYGMKGKMHKGPAIVIAFKK